MKLRVVIDTNIWIRILLRGRVTLPIAAAFNENKFQLLMSQYLLDEFNEVRQRPRLSKRINSNHSARLERQLRFRSEFIEVHTIPPNCRDPKDLPVLATAIDGDADVIVSGDNDLRDDDILRSAMAEYGIQLLGANSFLELLEEPKSE